MVYTMKKNIKLFKNLYLFSFIFISVFTFCEKSQSRSDIDPDYVASVQKWHKNRIESLTETTGWLSLAGLYWLKEGETRFGSAATNDIVFPKDKAPKFIGVFYLENNQVRVVINKGIDVRSGGNPVTETALQSDESGEPTVLSWGTLS